MAANAFLVAKWKQWYKFLDVNHDGIISFDDVEESRTRFSELHHLEADQRKKVIENFEKWWNDFIFRGKKGDITETAFVEMLGNDYKTDKKSFLLQMNKCIDMIFDVIDTNKDRSISEEEFDIAFKAYGQDKIGTDPKFFKAYNPTDGLVPLKDIVHSWVDFVSSDDASKPNVVKTAFDSN